MTDPLFITWDGGGNLPPALGIAAELARRGGSARFLGHASQRAAVESAGFPFEAIRSGDYDSAAPRGTVSGVAALTGIFADRTIGAQAVEAVRRDGADVVVVDCLLGGAAEVVRASGVPVVSLVHSLLGYFERNARGPIGGIVWLRGARMTTPLEEMPAIVAARQDFESSRRLPANARHVGVVWRGTPELAHAAGARPRVLVSLSTTRFPGQQRALQAIVDALGGLDVDAVVTTGPSIDPASLRAPANVDVRSSGDHTALLSTASLLIGHGGHGTTMRALAAGVPVLVLPMHPLMDQPEIGRAVERLGAGRMLPKSSSVERIRSAVAELLASDGARSSARDIGASIREADGAIAAADLIEAV